MMLPCRKSVNSAHAAKYLKRAESLARKLKSFAGNKTEITDGCIVRGSKSGNNLSAVVIEPPGKLLSFASCAIPRTEGAGSTAVNLDFITNGSEVFRPEHYEAELLDMSDSSREITNDVYSRGIYLGPAYSRQYDIRTSGSKQIFPATRPYVGASFMYGTYYVNDGVASNQRYLDVFVKSIASGFPFFSIQIHTSYLEEITGGYGVGEDLPLSHVSAAVIERGFGLFSVVFVVGKKIFSFQPPSGDVISKHETRLVQMDVDMKLSSKDDDDEPTASFHLFPESLIPYGMTPGIVGVNYSDQVTTAPAPSVMSVHDLDLDNEGNVIAAIKYQVKIQSPSRSSVYQGGGVPFAGHEGTGVMAFGLASWVGRAPQFTIHSTEVVEGDAEDALISSFAVSAEHAVFGNRQTIIDGDVYRWGLLVSRATAGVVATSLGLSYEVLSPYIVELKNGVLTGRNALNSPTDLYTFARSLYYEPGISIDFERDFFFNSDWIHDSLSGEKCKISSTCVAIPAGQNFETVIGVSTGYVVGGGTTEAGILFIDGERRKFEKIGDRSGLKDAYGMTMTCHQREVRDSSGALIVPSVMVICAYFDGGANILVRRGAIWDEDLSDSNKPSYTEIKGPSNTRIYNKYAYTGNALMLGKHGALFAGVIE